jgi:hypothetical protein
MAGKTEVASWATVNTEGSAPRGPGWRCGMHQTQETSENETASRFTCGPIVCPICWDHALEKIEGIHLSARTVFEHDISRVFLYCCSQWHLFALFQQEP